MNCAKAHELQLRCVNCTPYMNCVSDACRSILLPENLLFCHPEESRRDDEGSYRFFGSASE